MKTSYGVIGAVVTGLLVCSSVENGVRHFSSPRDAARERLAATLAVLVVGVWGGMHYPSIVVISDAEGQAIANHVNQNAMQRLHGRQEVLAPARVQLRREMRGASSSSFDAPSSSYEQDRRAISDCAAALRKALVR